MFILFAKRVFVSVVKHPVTHGLLKDFILKNSAGISRYYVRVLLRGCLRGDGSSPSLVRSLHSSSG